MRERNTKNNIGSGYARDSSTLGGGTSETNQDIVN